jgi:hypothetical protein
MAYKRIPRGLPPGVTDSAESAPPVEVRDVVHDGESDDGHSREAHQAETTSIGLKVVFGAIRIIEFAPEYDCAVRQVPGRRSTELVVPFRARSHRVFSNFGASFREREQQRRQLGQ